MINNKKALTRRHFMGLASATAAAASMTPLNVAEGAYRRTMHPIVTGPRSAQSDDDWQDVLAAFDLGGRVKMNTANLAPASAPGRAVFTELAASVDADPSFQNRGQFGALRQASREHVAAYLGANPDEIVFNDFVWDTFGQKFVINSSPATTPTSGTIRVPTALMFGEIKAISGRSFLVLP